MQIESSKENYKKIQLIREIIWLNLQLFGVTFSYKWSFTQVNNNAHKLWDKTKRSKAQNVTAAELDASF